MPNRQEKYGLSLPECLIVLALFAIVATIAPPTLSRMLDEQRVVAATNQVQGLMRLARSHAMTTGPVLLCDAQSDCSTFDTTSALILINAESGSLAAAPASGQKPLHHLQLPANTRIVWRRFRGNALIFQPSGILYFQNGHFLLCSGEARRRIVMNWSGRPRVAPGQRADTCED